MKRHVDHEEARAELGAAAMECLAPHELEAVLEHAATCAECTADLAALRDIGASLALAAPVVPMPEARKAAMRSRLLARAAADAGRAPPFASDPVPPRPTPALAASPNELAASRRGWRGRPWLALAASLVILAGIANTARLNAERRSIVAQLTALQAAQARGSADLRRLEDELAQRTRLLSGLTGPSVKVYDLASSSRREPTARMFWDRATNTWTMFAHNLPQPGAGKTFQLWLVTPSAKISAGTFAPDAGGSATVSAHYALDPSALRAIAVTEEPAGGVPQPTGPFVVLGAAGQ